MFGSYAGLKKEPNDLDVFFMLDSKNFEKYKEISSRIYSTIPAKVHDILQTRKDFEKSISQREPVIIEILKTGLILWGAKEIISLIENEHTRKNKELP